MSDIEDLVKGLDMFKRPTILEMYGPQAALLVLLMKLDVIGMRRISQSHVLTMISSAAQLQPPPCSIPCTIISLSRDFLQFCPKRMADKDLQL